MTFNIKIPFVELLGFELALFEGGQSQIDFDTRPEHENSFGVTHGGAIMTLLDVTMATAARSVQADMGVVTIEMKTSFMRPCRGKLVGKGRLMHRTGTMALPKPPFMTVRGRLALTPRAPSSTCVAAGAARALPTLAPVSFPLIDLAATTSTNPIIA